MKLLSNLQIRQINDNEFNSAMDILNEEFNEEMVRTKEELYEKFKKYNNFFIGIFLDNQIVGAIFGFPRGDYLLISELAIDSKFHNRGFGKKLIKAFEKEASKKRYKQINVGAEDNAIGFYTSLSEYKPFLLIQFEKKDYSDKDFNKFEVIKKYDFDGGNRAIEAEVKKADLKILNSLRKKFPKAWFQYIFIKKITTKI